MMALGLAQPSLPQRAGPAVIATKGWGSGPAAVNTGIGDGFDMETSSPPNPTADGNCNTWRLTDTRHCPALDGTTATIGHLRDNVHSFGGKFPWGSDDPEEVHRLQEQGDGQFPRSSYVHYENRIACDACGHGCMNG